MPIIRPERVQQTPVAQVQTPEANLMVGVASPRLEQAQTKQSSTAALLGGLFKGAVGAYQELKPKYDAQSAVQGALAATTEVEPFKEFDKKRQEVSWFFRDKYEEGYLNAAFSKEVADYRMAANTRAHESGLAGVPLQEYLQREREHLKDFSNKLTQYLPHMDSQKAFSTLDSLEKTSVGARTEYEKVAAAIATQEQDRMLDLGLTAFGNEFSQRVQTGDITSGLSSVQGGLTSILSSSHLNKDKKFDKAKQFLTYIAEQYDDPTIIDALQQVAQHEMGINAVPIISELRSQFNRAATQNTGKALFDLDSQVRSLNALSPDARADAMNNIKGNLLQYMQTGIVSPSTGLSMWNEANKVDTQAVAKSMLSAAVSNNLGSTAYSAMSGVSLKDARKNILDSFPDTPDGNWSMFTYARNSHDTYIMDKALERIGEGTSRLLSTFGSIANTPDGSVSSEMEGQWIALAGTMQGLSEGDKQQVLSYIPENRRFVVAQALEQEPQNATGVMFDTLRRLQENEAKGLYKAVPAVPTPEMISANSSLGFSSTSNWFSFGDEAKEQRARGTQALYEEYSLVRQQSPELLVGLEPKDINSVLQQRVKARQGEIQVNGSDIHFYTPAGTTLNDFIKAGYTGNSETFLTAMGERVQSNVNALINPDKIKSVQLEVGTAGAGADEFTVVVTSIDPNVPVQRARISASTVTEDAQRIHDGFIKGQDERARKLTGARPVTFGDASTGKVVNTFVDGTNSAGVAPNEFSNIMSHFMKYEGFLSKQKDMGDGRKSIGFGLHESSGIKLPESMTVQEATESLRDDLQKHFIPATQKLGTKYNLDLKDSGTLVLTDLMRHGWLSSAEPVAKSMGEFRKELQNPMRASTGEINVAASAVRDALRASTAYKQSQPARQKELLRTLDSWIYNTQAEYIKY